MAKQYITEFALNSYVTWGALLQQNEFDCLKIPDEKEPQIYFVGKRPRVSCDVNLTAISPEGLIKGMAIIHNEKVNQIIPFALQGVSHDNSYPPSLDLLYPYTVLTIKRANNRTNSMTVATALAMQSNKIQACLDMEILYIGQSFNGSKKYGIRKRIENHSTLQNIYAEAIRKFPNDEVWIGLLHFDIQAFMLIDGVTSDIVVNEEEDNAHVRKFVDGEISKPQIVNFTEAALIKYLQPTFNKTFKSRFPSPTHISYSSCYDIDLSSISVSFITDCLKCRTYTSVVPPNETHFIKFNLHSTEKRKNFFNGIV